MVLAGVPARLMRRRIQICKFAGNGYWRTTMTAASGEFNNDSLDTQKSGISFRSENTYILSGGFPVPKRRANYQVNMLP